MSRQAPRAREADPGPPLLGDDNTADLPAATAAFAALLGGRRFGAVDASTEHPAPMSPPVVLIDNGPAIPRAHAMHAKAKEDRDDFRDASLERRMTRRRPPLGCFAVTDLTDTCCHFPVSDLPPHVFCGAPKPDKVPYCSPHCRVAFAGGA